LAEHCLPRALDFMADHGGGAGGTTNPFSVPSQGEFFWLHKPVNTADAEKAKRKDLHIWEKQTGASKNGATRTLKDKDLPMAPLPPERQRQLAELRENVLAREKPDETFLTTIATKPAIGVCEPLKSHERDLRNYVAKKRESFLVQMALDVKKTEIVRLEERARLQEEALTQSQQMLDEDTKKFEEFRQGLFAKGRNIGNEAEMYAKKKADKHQRIKQLRQQISAIQSEVAKLGEQKDENEKYKQFLELVTPPEWKQQQVDAKNARKAARRQGFIDERMVTVLEKFADEERAAEKNIVEDPRDKKGRKKGREQEEEENRKMEAARLARRKKMERKKAEEEKRISEDFHDVSSEEEPELYFKAPALLMDTFTELEERYLFLIQSSQETEQQLDELEQTFDHNRVKMTGKVEQLNENIITLRANIAQEQRQREELQHKYEEKAGTHSQDKKLEDLLEKVRVVYQKCGFPHDHNADILQMLGGIESQLEVEIGHLDSAFFQDQDLVMRLEKQKLKEQSERVRRKILKEVDDKQKERQRKALLRSQDPVFKKAGKQVMYRSPPLRQERKVVHDSSDVEKNVRDHHVFGMYIDTNTQMPIMEAPVVEDRRKDRAGAHAGSTAENVAGEADATGDGDLTSMDELEVAAGVVDA